MKTRGSGLKNIEEFIHKLIRKVKKRRFAKAKRTKKEPENSERVLSGRLPLSQEKSGRAQDGPGKSK